MGMNVNLTPQLTGLMLSGFCMVPGISTSSFGN